MGSYLSNAARFHSDYIEAQRYLLVRLDAAQNGDNPWPSDREYETIAGLGRSASAEIHRGLKERAAVREPNRSDPKTFIKRAVMAAEP